MKRRISALTTSLVCIFAATVDATAARAAETTPWTAQTIAASAAQIDRTLATTPLVGAHIGVLAIDAERGTPLYAKNADDTFVPGSLVKLLTGITALRTLGTSYRFTTALRSDGNRLMLSGNGDPQLARAQIREAEQAARAAGMSAQMPFRIDDRAFAADPYPTGWAIADRPFHYAAPITALSVDENALHFSVSPAGVGAAPLMQISATDVAALRPAVTTLNRATTISAGGATTVDAAWFDRANIPLLAPPAALALGIAGTIARDAGTQIIDAAIPYPRLFIERLFSGYANADPAAPGAPRAGTLWTHRSKTLATMLPDMWLHSDNFIAECWLRAIGHATPEHPVTADAAAGAELRELQKIGVSLATTMIVDGSGLSRHNAASPRVFTTVLKNAYASNLRDTVMAALPVAGKSGTIAGRFRGTSLAGAVFAKTGSMTNVSNIAGFLRTNRHGTVVFAIFADDALIDDAPLHVLQGQILRALQDG